MAEKYGTVPKRFTKAWWEWYWMYYKWLTLGILFALMIITVSVVSSLTAEKYDITLTYAGETYHTDLQKEKVEEILSPLCTDLDGNGESSLFFSSLYLDPESNDVQQVQASATKLTMAIGEEETYLFLLTREIADAYKEESAEYIPFAPLEDWAKGNISGLDTYDAHGNSYGIAISDLDIFKEMGIPTDDVYMFMRYYPRKDQIKKQLEGYKESIELANKILAYK